MQRIKNKSVFSIWIILLFIILAAIVFIPAINEYHSAKHDFIQLWTGQGALLSETIFRSAARISRFDREQQDISEKRLTDLGYYIRQMDSLYFPHRNKVIRFARNHRNLGLFYCDADGNFYGRRNTKLQSQLRDYISRFIHKQSFTDPVHLLPKLPGINVPWRGVVVKRAMNNEFIVILPNPGRFFTPGSRPPLQGWLDHLTKQSSIEYIALFRAGELIAGSGAFPENIVPSHSPFPKWTIKEQKNKNIFEYSRQEPEGVAILIGLSTDALQRLQNNLIHRTVVSSVVMLILGIVLFTFILKRHSFSLLKMKYAQIQSYSTAILENMDEAIIVLDEKKQISIFNRAAEKLFNLKGEQVKDKTLTEIALPLPADLVLDILAEKSFVENDVVLEKRHLLISARSLSYTDASANSGQGGMYFVLIHDNTGQKELEEMRGRKNKLMAMGELASRMAHEIRNPLNAIGMLAQRLAMEFRPQQESQEFEKMTGSIRSESSRINQIVETFLNYARNPEFHFSSVNLKELILDNEHLLRSLGQARLEFQLQENCEASVDPKQFKQALINLVKNAFEVSADNGLVKIRLKGTEEKIILMVEDHGPGIAEEMKDKIFDLYFTTKNKGVGLGLSIVEKIISAHGGLVRIESPYYIDRVEKQGARFIIELPGGQSLV